MTERTLCGSCRSEDLEQVLDLGESPLADHFPTDPYAVETTYPLRLLVCKHCSLAQLSEIVPDDLLWSDYGFYASTSPALVRYHIEFADLMQRRYGSPLTLEVACNDGSLLSRLSGKKIGIDAAAGPVSVALDRGLDVRQGLFGSELATQLRDEIGPVGLVIAQNVVAHVANLQDFLSGIHHILDDNGVAVIEVQSLADLLLGNQFDHIYHEHRSFFSRESLVNALWYAGLVPLEYEHTPMQGGSLRVTCRKVTDPTDLPESPYPGLGNIRSLLSIQPRADYLKAQLIRVLCDEANRGTVAGWAASAKSSTLLNWCDIGPELVKYIVDTTPAKIGRYTPGTHIPIVDPREYDYPDTFLLLAHNYVSRIRHDPFRGRWLVPIPQPVVM